MGHSASTCLGDVCSACVVLAWLGISQTACKGGVHCCYTQDSRMALACTCSLWTHGAQCINLLAGCVFCLCGVSMAGHIADCLQGGSALLLHPGQSDGAGVYMLPLDAWGTVHQPAWGMCVLLVWC